MAALGCAVLAASMVHALVDFNFHLPACALTFFSIAGVASSRTQRQQRAPVCLPGNPLFVVAGLGAAAWIGGSALPAQKAWALLPYTNDGLAELSEDRIRILAERITAADRQAGPLLARLGDAARHKLAHAEARVIQARAEVATGTTAPETLMELAREQQRLGELALALYDRAAAVNPLDDTLKVKKGIVLDLMGRPEEAFLVYSQARQNQPHNRFFVYVLGYHFLRHGYLEQALSAYREALALPLGVRERNRAILEGARQAISLIEAELKRQKEGTQPTEKLD